MDTVRELAGFLQGETPEGFRLGSQPELDEDTAWSVIYVLQEKFELITDRVDKCDYCGSLFHTRYSYRCVEPEPMRETEVYEDLQDIPEFSGLFCSEGCLIGAARIYRDKDSKPIEGEHSE